MAENPSRWYWPKLKNNPVTNAIYNSLSSTTSAIASKFPVFNHHRVRPEDSWDFSRPTPAPVVSGPLRTKASLESPVAEVGTSLYQSHPSEIGPNFATPASARCSSVLPHNQQSVLEGQGSIPYSTFTTYQGPSTERLDQNYPYTPARENFRDPPYPVVDGQGLPYSIFPPPQLHNPERRDQSYSYNPVSSRVNFYDHTPYPAVGGQSYNPYNSIFTPPQGHSTDRRDQNLNNASYPNVENRGYFPHQTFPQPQGYVNDYTYNDQQNVLRPVPSFTNNRVKPTRVAPPSFVSDQDEEPPQRVIIPKFDGSSNYELFKFEWLSVANNYKWRPENRISSLLASLSGKAKSAIGVPKDMSNITEKSIWADLDRRFSSDNDFETLNEQLMERSQRKGESYDELGLSILNLVRRLEPDSKETVQDRRALAHFVKSISDEYVREWTKNRKCSCLDDAITYAKSISRNKRELTKPIQQFKTAAFSNSSELEKDVKGLKDKIDRLNSNTNNHLIMTEIRKINDRIDKLGKGSQNPSDKNRPYVQNGKWQNRETVQKEEKNDVPQNNSRSPNENNQPSLNGTGSNQRDGGNPQF